jgi:hypothetical protein
VEFTEALLWKLAIRWGSTGSGRFVCPLHGGEAEFGTNDRGEPALACCKGRWRSLGEVRAVLGYGYDRRPGGRPRSNKELAAWNRRLAWELGGFEPVAVSVPTPPAGSPGSVTKAAVGFALLCGLRWADWKREPVTYSMRFAVAWCGISHREAQAALKALEEVEAIRHVGNVGRCRLWEPGPPGADGEVLTPGDARAWL